MTDIRELNISTRTINALINANIRTVEQLTAHTRQYVRSIKGIGRKLIKELDFKFKERGLKFGRLDEPPKPPHTDRQKVILRKLNLDSMIRE